MKMGMEINFQTQSDFSGLRKLLDVFEIGHFS